MGEKQMEINDIYNQIKKIIISILEIDIAETEIDDDEILFGGGLGIPSITSLKIIVEIEKYFNIEFDDDEDLSYENINRISSLGNYVYKKLH
jgi:acyl carrier protein